MVASPKRDKSNPFAKCLTQDQHFLEQLFSLKELDNQIESERYTKHIQKIQASIEANELYALEVTKKALFSRLFLI